VRSPTSSDTLPSAAVPWTPCTATQRRCAGSAVGEDAIRWYYRAIQADPRLLDVTGELVELLVQDSRRVEALSVIGAFVRALPDYKTYWAGRVIAIEAGMGDSVNSSRDPNVTLKIPTIGRHYYVPLRLGGGSHYEPFIVDTGASALTFNSTWVEEAQVQAPGPRCTRDFQFCEREGPSDTI
jgi:hypothetical protein